MKKLVTVIVSMMMCFSGILSVQAVSAATPDIDLLSASNSEYTFSITVKPGDHIVVYNDELSEDSLIFDIDDLDKYDGYLFDDAPIRMQATHEANIRTGPGMKFDIVDRLIVNDVVEVFGKFKGVDCEWSWFLLGDGNYVSAHLLDDVDESIEEVRPDRAYYEIYMFEETKKKKVTEDKANVRSGPGTQYSILYTLEAGDKVKAIGTIDITSSDGTWYILKDGGFVSTHLFKK